MTKRPTKKPRNNNQANMNDPSQPDLRRPGTGGALSSEGHHTPQEGHIPGQAEHG